MPLAIGPALLNVELLPDKMVPYTTSIRTATAFRMHNRLNTAPFDTRMLCQTIQLIKHFFFCSRQRHISRQVTPKHILHVHSQTRVLRHLRISVHIVSDHSRNCLVFQLPQKDAAAVLKTGYEPANHGLLGCFYQLPHSGIHACTMHTTYSVTTLHIHKRLLQAHGRHGQLTVHGRLHGCCCRFSGVTHVSDRVLADCTCPAAATAGDRHSEKALC